MELAIHPLTIDVWPDFEELFGKNGAYAGCWCMWWRCTRREFEQYQGEGNRLALYSIVEKGVIPGILGYKDGRAVGWCSVAPREQYGSLERSRVLRRLDEAPVWSRVCLFVSQKYRDQGVGEALIRGAIEYVKNQGGRVVEAYPYKPREKRLSPVSSFMGTPIMFERAGFEEVAQPSKSKSIMRYWIE
jgi:GNAT superfamily N-acetyltransferase